MGTGERCHGCPKGISSAAPDSLLIREAGEVAPVGGEVLELEGIHRDEHQHGIGYHQPPEDTEQLPPQAVVDLQVVTGEQGR